jgi:hypothetical protein
MSTRACLETMPLELVWDPVWVAAITPFLVCAMFGAGACGADPDHCNTISEMVSQHRMLLNGFSMACFGVLLSQWYYTVHMLHRYGRLANNMKGAKVQGLIGYPVAMGLVFTGGFFTLSGTVGFVLNSMDLHKDAHTVYAGMAFAAILVYLLGFLVLAFYLKGAHNREAAMGAWLVSAGALGALGADWPFWLEFVHIAASTVCAFMLVPPETHAVLATKV